MDQTPLKRPQMFFATAAIPCPYIEGKMERKIVTELSGSGAPELHETLAHAGFRRSHSIAYAPACLGCNQCVPVRVKTAEFTAGRTLRRIWNANKELLAIRIPPVASTEQFALFAAYQADRHAGSDMANMGFYEYCSMVEDSPIETFVTEFRETGGRLIAAVLVDKTRDGLSAVYSFFDTRGRRQGLGNFIVMWLIDYAASMNLPYVYLGYWIRDCTKMAYKTKFRPLEALTPAGWQPLDLDRKAAADG